MSQEGRLCSYCQRHDLRELFGLSTKKPSTGIRLYAEIEANAGSCDFCALVLAALHNSRVWPTLKAEEKRLVIFAPEVFGTVVHTASGEERPISRVWVNLSADGKSITTDFNGTRYGHGIQLLADDESQRSEPYFLGRKIGEDKVDFNLVKTWLKLCEENHGGDCASIRASEGFDLEECFRLIDVESRCVVNASPSERFFALSYTWGTPSDMGKEHLQLTSQTKWLKTPGAIGDDKPYVPKTIKDAVALTSDLGCRYIWIDAICITQDDEEDREVQIAAMDVIFGRAALTIVAAAGTHANYGLMGCGRPFEVMPRQAFAQIDGLSFSTVQWPHHACLRNCEWDSRGWTFQEKILSKRLLLFTEQQAFFHCENALWYEDCILENTDPKISLKFLQERGLIRYDKLNLNADPFDQYALAVDQYYRRTLGDEGDGLKAFTGLMQLLRPKFGTPYFCGLPESHFDTALMWTHVNHFPERRREGFPTWSWVGWRGGQGSGFIFPQGTIPELRFFRSERKAAFVRIQRDFKRNSEAEKDWHAGWKGDINAEFPASYKPALLNQRILVHFWTSSAQINVEYEGPESESRFGNERLKMKGVEDKHIGTIYLNKEWRSHRSAYLEFVVISRDGGKKKSKSYPDWTSGLNAMLIEREGSVAFRVNVPTTSLAEEDWIALKRQWLLIALA